jgi:DnaK suppressor protein
MAGEGVGEETAAARHALEEVEETLAEVAGALGRLDDGSYGICEACGRPVGEGRLEKDPLARRCETCGST